MLIVIFVATDARTRNSQTIISLFFMAGVAVRFLMAAIKLEFGALVVIEIPSFP